MTIDSAIAEHMPYLRVARRKGKRVRLQNIHTARMGGWITDPYAEAAHRQREAQAQAAPRSFRIAPRRAGKTLQLQAEAMAYWREGDDHPSVDTLTVPELRTALGACGLPFTTRMRKAELVARLLGTELS